MGERARGDARARARVCNVTSKTKFSFVIRAKNVFNHDEPFTKRKKKDPMVIQMQREQLRVKRFVSRGVCAQPVIVERLLP